MPILVSDAIGELAREVGDIDDVAYFSATDIFNALKDGLKEFNLVMPQQFEIVGTDSGTAYYNPDPNGEQQRLMLLFASRRILKSELSRFARQAVVHSNPTGKTDLTQRAAFTREALKQVDADIRYLTHRLAHGLVTTEMGSVGASVGGRCYPEGYDPFLRLNSWYRHGW